MLRSLVFSVSSVEDFFLDLVIHHLYGCLTTAVEECQQCGHPQRPGLENNPPDEDVTNLYKETSQSQLMKPSAFCTNKMDSFPFLIGTQSSS